MNKLYVYTYPASRVTQLVKNLPAKETSCQCPGSGRSPGEGNGNPLQYSYLENSMDRRAWWATVHEVTKEMDNNNNNLKLPIQQSSLCHQVYACMCVCVSTCDLTVVVQLLSCVQLFATPWTIERQTPLFMEFSR